MKATAIAHANIALVKYWGKRDEPLNLPAVGSVSITLEALSTTTTVTIVDAAEDHLILNGKPASRQQTQRTFDFVDLLRTIAGSESAVKIESENNFPTGAGLASSASGFAALTLASAAAFNIEPTARQLSEWARIGSGSAARSIYGGFVEMHHGEKADGSDAVAEPLFDRKHWPLETFILITSDVEKPIGSTDGMNLTRDTSPYYQPWIEDSQRDLANIRSAIHERDFEKLAEISEFSCLKMHGLAMSANPGLLYWNGITVDLIHHVRRLRKMGLRAFFTIDAGPQVKVICHPGDTSGIAPHLKGLPGVQRIIRSGLGGDARIIDD